jgi:hypothetical protein
VAPDTSTATDADAQAALADIERLGGQLRAARDSIGKVIYGQQAVIDQTLVTLLSGGHLLLIGVPGLAKTLLVETLGVVLGMEAKRIQFTPDLMPADILGSEVMEESDGGRRSFRFIPGPVFAQLLMADEINRASPRTQSALLQSMQEKHVTVAGKRYDLPAPFHVLATQNPLEQEGTYPLPEAQLDRFLLQVDVGYPDEDAERQIMIATTGANGPLAGRPDGRPGAGPPPADRPERGRGHPEACPLGPSRDFGPRHRAPARGLGPRPSRQPILHAGLPRPRHHPGAPGSLGRRRHRARRPDLAPSHGSELLGPCRGRHGGYRDCPNVRPALLKCDDFRFSRRPSSRSEAALVLGRRGRQLKVITLGRLA